MDVGIIFILFIVVCLAGLYFTLRKSKTDYVMSIKESLDLCELPVITMMNNGRKFNFMLDTGSTDNHVSPKAFNQMSSIPSGKVLNIRGFNGNEESNKGHALKLSYKDLEFNTDVFVSPALDNTFDWIKKESGVQIHGIIGNKFLAEYGYVLDFKRLKVYAKN